MDPCGIQRRCPGTSSSCTVATTTHFETKGAFPLRPVRVVSSSSADACAIATDRRAADSDAIRAPRPVSRTSKLFDDALQGRHQTKGAVHRLRTVVSKTGQLGRCDCDLERALRSTLSYLITPTPQTQSTIGICRPVRHRICGQTSISRPRRCGIPSTRLAHGGRCRRRARSCRRYSQPP